jgi:hypothetical protein
MILIQQLKILKILHRTHMNISNYYLKDRISLNDLVMYVYMMILGLSQLELGSDWQKPC